MFQTQLALGYSVLSHRQLVPRAAVARPSGGLEGESPSSDCRRLVCSSMLLLCRGALSREKTGKEPTNISCSNYTILYIRQTLLKLRKNSSYSEKCYFIGVGHMKCWDETILFICLHSATIKRDKNKKKFDSKQPLISSKQSNHKVYCSSAQNFCWYPSPFLCCLQKFLANSWYSMGSQLFCSCIFTYFSHLTFFEIL